MSIPDLNTLPSDRALEILISQYDSSDNFKLYLTALLEDFNELHASGLSSINDRTIDAATGYVLDVIGEIVGQPRATKLQVADSHFGFDGSFGGETFGSDINPATGGLFRSDTVVLYNIVDWADAEYRKFIKARIIKNTKAITVDTILEVLLLIVDGVDDAIITNVTPLMYNIHIPSVVSDNDKLLILTDSLLPVPVGCSYDISDSNGQFNNNI